MRERKQEDGEEESEEEEAEAEEEKLELELELELQKELEGGRRWVLARGCNADAAKLQLNKDEGPSSDKRGEEKRR